MKTQTPTPPHSRPPSGKQPFTSAMREAPTPPLGIREQRRLGATKVVGPVRVAKGCTVATPPGLVLAGKKRHEVGEGMVRAREQMHAEAERLEKVEQERAEGRRSGIEGRTVDLICRELLADLEPVETSRAGAPPGGAPVATPAEQPVTAQTGTPTQPAAAVEARLAQAMQLIEKIETFLKGRRPALALSLGGELDARVEVERLGPGKIAIKIRGRKGPPSPELLGEIRDELRARGLQLGALSVG